MKLIHQFAVVTGTVVALTFTGVVAIHAQIQSKPVYLIAEVNVKDQEGFKEYGDKVGEIISQYGGMIIAFDTDPESVEGAETNGFIAVVKFNSIEDFNKWKNSPEYTAIVGARHRTADTRSFLVEELPANQ